MTVLLPAVLCYHCGLPVPEDSGEGRQFCCRGCHMAYEWIHASGLEEFYRRREGNESPRPEVDSSAIQTELLAYDTDAFHARYVRQDGTGISEVSLFLEGIHCAACVWLNEKLLSSLPGVQKARVNFATHRATVRWDRQQTPLSTMIMTLRRIGYHAEPYDIEMVEGRHGQRHRDLLIRLGVAGFGAANVMLIAVALYAGYWQGMEPQFKSYFHWVSWLIATPVVFYSGWIFHRDAWVGLRARRLTMDLPISLGALVTYFYSVWVMVIGSGEVYFDSVATLVFALLTGRYLEAMARRKAADASERLLRLEPRVATVLREAEEIVIPTRDVRVGEMVLIRPGERIPVDGVVREGASSVDNALLTGESLAILKQIGDTVASGTLNLEGVLRIEATHVGEESTLARIVRLVEDAQTGRPPLQRLADRVAGWFIAGVLLVALLTFSYWLGEIGTALALQHAVAVLIITCPCALGLAVPVSVITAVGLAARMGILIKQTEALEGLARVDRVVLDKTGVVTAGEPKVVKLLLVKSGRTAEELLTAAASLELFSEHPLGKAIVREARARSCCLESIRMETVRNTPGMGVEGWTDAGLALRVGRPEFIIDWIGTPLLEPVEDAGEVPVSWIACAEQGQLLGWIGLSDPLLDDVAESVQRCQELGLSPLLLSGDRKSVVEAIARQAGIAACLGGVFPEGKVQAVVDLQNQGYVVAMVGDGLNDAPAMARANVSIAVVKAVDVSVEVADIVLLRRELSLVPQAILLGRATVRIIRQNFMLALCYNLLAIPLAAFGYVIPLVAAIAMPLSSLTIILNALRLRKLMKRQTAGLQHGKHIA